MGHTDEQEQAVRSGEVVVLFPLRTVLFAIELAAFLLMRPAHWLGYACALVFVASQAAWAKIATALSPGAAAALRGLVALTNELCTAVITPFVVLSSVCSFAVSVCMHAIDGGE
ncbi:hypothetical protein KFE25_005486 [Diacronema lutheri]|uniref:Uncharacterized protein n=1 Tax=Diacronema lutheri TaxID=2081491 RepID=A0A8J5XJY9_DIALT|nr:hypothetical protein KFE25_005486 [Diacronema lutheri]